MCSAIAGALTVLTSLERDARWTTACTCGNSSERFSPDELMHLCPGALCVRQSSFCAATESTFPSLVLALHEAATRRKADREISQEACGFVSHIGLLHESCITCVQHGAHAWCHLSNHKLASRGSITEAQNSRSKSFNLRLHDRGRLVVQARRRLSTIVAVRRRIDCFARHSLEVVLVVICGTGDLRSRIIPVTCAG